MTKCRICGSNLYQFMDFGRMPIANGFLSPEEYANEFFYSLKVGHCLNCSMVQLLEQPESRLMFHDHYAFFSSTSSFMAAHFKEIAEEIIESYLGDNDPFIVEIGCNDGIMLEHIARKKIRHLGIEPSSNVAAVAEQKGIYITYEFFDEKSAARILSSHGPADVIFAANVMCHIPDLNSVVKGMKLLLRDKGVIIFEDPYLGDIVEKVSYDQIYDEHVFYFSLESLSYLFNKHGLEIINCKNQPVHGGSMRYYVAHKGVYPVSENINLQKQQERVMGLERPETYDQLRKKIEYSRDQLLSILHNLRNEGKRVVGYAATSKSTTVINYCGITPELIEFISDTTPIKHGKFSPGAHIPILPYEKFIEEYPDYALLFGWNHSEEIMKNEQSFMKAGGKWIVYVPIVQII